MATLACLLHDLGNSVSGYDDVKEWKFTEIGLDDRKIPIYYDGNHEIDSDWQGLSVGWHPTPGRIRKKD